MEELTYEAYPDIADTMATIKIRDRTLPRYQKLLVLSDPRTIDELHMKAKLLEEGDLRERGEAPVSAISKSAAKQMECFHCGKAGHIKKDRDILKALKVVIRCSNDSVKVDVNAVHKSPVTADEQRLGGSTFRLDKNMEPTQTRDLREILTKYSDVLDDTTVTKHHIELIPGSKPVSQPLRRYSLREEEIKTQVEAMLKANVIEHSTSP
ncbi:hypothetical protein GZH46_02239, partial [Fragariocoptes setiger]